MSHYVSVEWIFYLFEINLLNAWIKAFALWEGISSRWTALLTEHKKTIIQTFSLDLIIKGLAKSTTDISNTVDNLVRPRSRGRNGTSRFFTFYFLQVTQCLITERTVLRPLIIQNLSLKIVRKMETPACLLAKCFCSVSRSITKWRENQWSNEFR